MYVFMINFCMNNDKFDLNKIFSPQTIAVIGASNKPGNIGGFILSNLLKSRYKGTIYPVSLNSKSVFGIRAYRTIKDIPDSIDLAVVVVPANYVSKVLEECGEVGVPGAVIISAGFKEVGEEGKKREEEVVKIAKSYGIRIIGPNCFGVINTDENVSMNATFSEHLPTRGNVALISQSGALCEGILSYARYEKIGFSKFVSIGNRADVTEAELLKYLGEGNDTDVILMYIESLADPKSFLDAAVKITEKKPIIAIKSGGTVFGSRATLSHTGSLAGSDDMYEGVFEQAGIIRVNSLPDLFKAAKIFSKKNYLNGSNIAILTNSGGPGVMAADASSRYGLNVPEIRGELLEQLKSFLPPSAGFHNPVDILGDGNSMVFSKALNTLLSSNYFDGVISIITPVGGLDVKQAIQEIKNARDKYNKPITTTLFGLSDLSEENSILDSYNLPHFEFPEDAAWAMSLLYKHYLWASRQKTTVKHYEVDLQKAKSIIEKAKSENRKMLSISESIELLKCYSIPTVNYVEIRSKNELLPKTSSFKYPLVMKILSPDVVHKFDVGGVKMGIENQEDLVDAYDEIIKNVKAKQPNARIEGVIVEEFVPDGKETIIGAFRDPLFGPILMFGLGGIYVEAFHDVSFRLAPIKELSADNMISAIRSFKLLTGVRGEKGAKISAIADVLKRISQMVTELEDIKELDINPLIATPEGCIAVDIRIIL